MGKDGGRREGREDDERAHRADSGVPFVFPVLPSSCPPGFSSSVYLQLKKQLIVFDTLFAVPAVFFTVSVTV